MIGRVVSIKMQKSAVVLAEAKKKHALYGKIFLRTKKYLVDDPIGVKVGDVVEFLKVKPISKMKHFRITKILGKDEVALGTEVLKQGAEKVIAEVLPVEEKEKVDVTISAESKEETKGTKEKIKKERKQK